MVVSVTAGVLIARERKLKELEGLGKLKSSGRPPKVRIVYSRKQTAKERQKIGCSYDAYKVLKEIWSGQIDVREEMVVLLLDRSNKLLGYSVLSTGGITGTVADVRLIFSTALNSLATSIVISHNHPSGNINPSGNDVNLTKKIKEAGAIMDIQLMDHIIISNDDYYSFADEDAL